MLPENFFWQEASLSFTSGLAPITDVPSIEAMRNIKTTLSMKGEHTMYADIQSISYNAKSNQVVISGIDLDSVLLNDWNQEFSDDAEVSFKFDLTVKGQRIYLYKLIKSQVKEKYNTLEEGLMALVGKITPISSNFIVKAEG